MFKVVVSANVAFVNKYVYHIFLDYCALPGAVILNSMRYESIFLLYITAVECSMSLEMFLLKLIQVSLSFLQMNLESHINFRTLLKTQR